MEMVTKGADVFIV